MSGLERVPHDSGLAVRSAVDSLLREFGALERERVDWFREKESLLSEVSRLNSELERTNQKYVSLAKRHRVLQMSLRHLRDAAEAPKRSSKARGRKAAKGEVGDECITIAYRKDSERTKWYATLPASLETSEVLSLLRDMDSKFGTKSPATAVLSEDSKEADGLQQAAIGLPTAGLKRASFVDGVAAAGKSQMTRLKLSTHKLRSHMDAVRSLCFDEENDWLLSVGDECVVKCWSVEWPPKRGGSQPLATVRLAADSAFRCQRHGGSGVLTTVCSLPGTGLVVTGGEAGVLSALSCEKLKGHIAERKAQRSKRKYAYKSAGHSMAKVLGGQLAFSLAIADEVLWDLLAPPPPKQGSVAALCADSTVRVFDVAKQKCSTLLKAAAPHLACGLWLDVNTVVGGHSGGQLSVLDLRSSEAPAQLLSDDSSRHSVSALCTSPSSGLLYAACGDGCLRLWDLRASAMVKAVRAHTDAVTALCTLHRGEDSLMSASHDCGVRTWQLAASECSIIQDIEPQNTHLMRWDEGVLALAFSQKHQLAASAGADGVIRVFN